MGPRYVMILASTALGCAQVSGFDDLEFEDSAIVSFCNTLEQANGDDVVLTLEVGKGDAKVVYNAATGCCTPCREVNAGKTPVRLHNNGEILSDAPIDLSGDAHYILIATAEVGVPSVGFWDLTDAGANCESTVLSGHERCGRAEEGDAPAGGTQDSSACGGFVSDIPACDACMRNQCCDEAALCSTNQDCIMLNACLNDCPASDQLCLNDCYVLFAAGLEALANFDSCLVQFCEVECT
jgi:hypothetical protein